MFSTARVALTGAIGTVASFGGLITSILPQIEAGLRIVSLAIGIAVGVVTLVKLHRGGRGGQRER